MMSRPRRIVPVIRAVYDLEAYAAAFAGFACAVVNLWGDVIADSVKWSVLFAALGVVVCRPGVPAGPAGSGVPLRDRSAFEGVSFATRLRSAREVWVYGPSAVNLLTPQVCGLLRNTVLSVPSGTVKVVVLDSAASDAVAVVSRHLDDPVDHTLGMFRSSLVATTHQLRRLADGEDPGRFAYRLLDVNPGFSLVALDPGTRHGTVIVEFHGFRNETTGARMHVELTPGTDSYWYGYWVAQFAELWRAARSPDRFAGADPADLASVDAERHDR